jgi:hypothetical protein
VLKDTHWARLAALAVPVLLLGGGAIAAGTAQAASLPSCSTGYHCANVSPGSTGSGEAGYYGADDNHTHYRYVQTVVVANAHLANLNGNQGGAVGVELCDPNTGNAAQVGLWWNHANSTYEVSYATPSNGALAANADPCVESGFILTSIGSAPVLAGGSSSSQGQEHIAQGDTILLALFYVPWPRSPHYGQVSVGVMDLTAGWARQAYVSLPSVTADQAQFWEFGIGAVDNNGVNLTAPAGNPLETFDGSEVTCYSCRGPVPISDVQAVPVDGFTAGGLYEAQFVNGNSQVQMSASDSLAAGSTAFTLYEGSTSS